ncbi:MAG: asparagine synthase (glutamine-hydrolyzing) [Bacteroidota bacterium]
MCGIAGFIDYQNSSSIDLLEKMTMSFQHRGPDGHGAEVLHLGNATVGLGQRRLAIIDLSDHAKQPMQFKNFWITFNGEIYNYKEIKEALVALGHTFLTNSDTEVILHAYQQWAEKCLDHFIGMFAFVITDTIKNEIFMARDRAGVKPLFIYHKNDILLFASELKAFHVHPNFEKKINLSAVAAYMQFGNVPTPHCIFEDCFKLKPGHYLKFDLATKSCTTFQYWSVYDAYNKPKLELSFDEAKRETEQLLASAFNYRMVADVPVGIFLSGGYDSVSVAALLQKDRSEKLKTYTISVPDIGLNEAPFAKELAQHIGTDHTEIDCSQKEAMDLIEKLPFYYDEPFGDSSAIPTTLVSLMARKHVTVALSADGGDEVFAGYNRYDYLMRFGNKLNKIPSPLRKTAAGMMNLVPANKIPVLKNKYNFHNRYEKLKGLLRDPSPEMMMQSLTFQFPENDLKKLMKTNFQLPITSYESKELKKEFYSPLAYMQSIDYTTYMLDDILQKVDRATMSASLEGREPFMDQRIIEFAAQLPDSYKYHNGIKKYILKEIVHQYVPKTMLDRPKMGFAIPIAEWMSKELRPLVEEYLSEERIQHEGILNWDFVSDLKTKFLSGKKELDVKIWCILMFEMWFEKWMKK